MRRQVIGQVEGEGEGGGAGWRGGGGWGCVQRDRGGGTALYRSITGFLHHSSKLCGMQAESGRAGTYSV